MKITFRKSSAPTLHPLKKSTLPLKIQKVQVLLPFGQHYKFFRPPLAERVGGHCELAFLLLVVLFSITDLDMMYFLRKIFPPSEVLEVRIYSHLQCFKGGNPPSRRVGIIWRWESDKELFWPFESSWKLETIFS